MKSCSFLLSCFVCLFFSLHSVFAQDNLSYLAAESWGGAEWDYSQAVAIDKDNNLYIVGNFTSANVDFDPGPGTDIHSASTTTALDVFLTKYNSDGSYAWTRTFGGTSNDYGHAVTTDQDGNVYVTGQFAQTVDFDTSLGTYSKTSAGSFDVYVSKFSSSGTWLWTRVWGGPNYDAGEAVAVSKFGTVYVGGFFQTTVDFDPGLGVDTRTRTGSDDYATDMFLSRLDTTGAYWGVNTFGGTNDDRIAAIDVDSEGYFYFAGYFNGSVDFDPGAKTNTLSSGTGEAAVLTKYSSNGVYQWALSWEAGTSYAATDIKLDDAGNIYIAGAIRDTVDLDPGDGEALFTPPTSDRAPYVLKLNANRVYQWAAVWGGGQDSQSEGVCVNSEGTVYVAGVFENTSDFDPGEEQELITSAGSDDFFLSKFNADGTYDWVKTFGSTEYDVTRACAVDSNDTLTLVGGHRDTIDFDPSDASDLRTSNGSADMFFQQFVPSYAISGQILTEGEPLQGVTVDGGALGTTETDSSGNYTFTGLAAEDAYTITPEKYGYIFSPSSAAGSVSSDVTANFTAGVDDCPDDSSKTEAGVCGCGESDADTNGSGQADCLDPKVETMQPAKPRFRQKGNLLGIILQKVEGARYAITYAIVKNGRRGPIRTVRTNSNIIRTRRIKPGMTLLMVYRLEIGSTVVSQSVQSPRGRYRMSS